MDSAYQFTRCVMDCSKPTIAVIDGYCLAGAMELAQMCDIRYCSDDARFGAIEARFSHGLATMIMPWIVGDHCRELIYTGDMFDAQEALRIGLVTRVYPKADLARETLKIAKRMSRVALSCLQWNKRALGRHSKSWVSAPLCVTASRPPPSWTPKARRNMIGSTKSGGPRA